VPGHPGMPRVEPSYWEKKNKNILMGQHAEYKFNRLFWGKIGFRDEKGKKRPKLIIPKKKKKKLT
jgi:hypothetical protein